MNASPIINYSEMQAALNAAPAASNTQLTSQAQLLTILSAVFPALSASVYASQGTKAKAGPSSEPSTSPQSPFLEMAVNLVSTFNAYNNMLMQNMGNTVEARTAMTQMNTELATINFNKAMKDADKYIKMGPLRTFLRVLGDITGVTQMAFVAGLTGTKEGLIPMISTVITKPLVDGFKELLEACGVPQNAAQFAAAAIIAITITAAVLIATGGTAAPEVLDAEAEGAGEGVGTELANFAADDAADTSTGGVTPEPKQGILNKYIGLFDGFTDTTKIRTLAIMQVISQSQVIQKLIELVCPQGKTQDILLGVTTLMETLANITVGVGMGGSLIKNGVSRLEANTSLMLNKLLQGSLLVGGLVKMAAAGYEVDASLLTWNGMQAQARLDSMNSLNNFNSGLINSDTKEYAEMVSEASKIVNQLMTSLEELGAGVAAGISDYTA